VTLRVEDQGTQRGIARQTTGRIRCDGLRGNAVVCENATNPEGILPLHRLASGTALVVASMMLTAVPITSVDGAPSAQAASSSGIKDSPTGEVYGVAVGANGTTYAVGSFTSAGASTGPFASLSTSTALVDRNFPPIVGDVAASAADDSGGVFIGGPFTAVDGQSRQGAAHILSDGTLDPAWAPAITGDIQALHRVGNTVYIAGEFSDISGTARWNLAAVDATTGAVLSDWNPPPPNFGVTSLASDDSAIYVGGNFTTIGLETRNRIAALSPATGITLGWNPNANGSVSALVTRGGLVYAGGFFTSIGGQTRNRLAALNGVASDDSSATPWNPNSNEAVLGIAIDDTTVYVVGNFTTIGSVSRSRGAAVRIDDTGSILAWNPSLSTVGRAVAAASDGVYVAGDFSSVNGGMRNFLAKVDKITGVAQAWDSSLQSAAFTLALGSTGALYVGGIFSHVNLMSRSRAAAFDASGRLTAWAPQLGSAANAIALQDDAAYIVGAFTAVTEGGGSVTRSRAAAFRTDDTGTLTSWNPDFNQYAQNIDISGGVAYIVGGFTAVNGGVTRNYAAAVDLVSGTKTDWSPNLNFQSWVVVIDDTVAYLGGNFSSVGGAPRNRAAAISTDGAGTLTSWNPDANLEVWDIALEDDLAYLVGGFTTIGGSSRSHAAAVRTDDTGTLTDWNPELTCSGCTSRGRSIQLSGSSAFIAGTFNAVNGVSGFSSLVAVSTDDTGNYLPDWRPVVTSNSSPPRLQSLALAGSRLQVGGEFRSIRLADFAYPAYLASLPLPATAPAAPTGITATAGSTSASVAWTPGSDGGSPVTRVEFALDDTVTVDDSTTNTTSPYAMSGLANGRTYTVYVRLVNAVNPGAWSVASASFTPRAPSPPAPPLMPPGAPAAVNAVAGNASASVTWTPPVDSGSFPVDGYVVTASPGGRTCTSVGTTCTVTGLSNGTSYTLTVTASNAAGDGPTSARSNAVTPRTVPGSPVRVSAKPGVESARITWSPPTDDGGADVTGYSVATAPAGAGCVTDGATSCTLTALKAGRAYTVTVVAINAAGESVPSAPVSVTPTGQPRIIITGSRDGRMIRISGTVSDSDITKVRPRYRLGDQNRFRTAALTRAVDDGAFKWQRIANRKITVYIQAGGLRSNTVTIRAR
jgi:hypothetical protein